jgi:hypothetical protein
MRRELPVSQSETEADFDTPAHTNLKTPLKLLSGFV